MVKNILSTIFILTSSLLFSGCFVFYENFVFSSDVDDRREEMNNFMFLDTLPPLDTGGGSYSFVVLADTHIENGKRSGLDRLPQLVAANSDIKFAIVLGDITTNGDGKDFRTYMEIAGELAAMGVPFYPVIGNHDIMGDGWKFWKNNIGSTIYRIDDANTTLIILDTANIYFGKSQMDWLERQLKVTNRDVFVFAHVPLFASGTVEWLQITDLNERARMTSILRNKCDIMFAGHAHSNTTYKTGNVEFVTVADFRDKKAYCLVTVTDEGIFYEFKKL